MSNHHIIVGIRKPSGRDNESVSIEAMRSAITLAASRDSQLARQCYTRADVQGLNGEDRMTLLAYFALRAYQDIHDILMDQAILDNRPRVIVKEG